MHRMNCIATTSLVMLATAATSQGAIIISQYYEGASNDKYIELFNTGPSSVDLGTGGYRYGLWSNASREAWKSGTAPSSSLALTGTIAAGATYILENSSAANPAYVSASVSNAAINFNGDDSVAIYTGAVYSFANVVDAFGVAGASTYADTSYVRNATITSGTNADFNSSHWTQYSLAQVANAGSTTPPYLGYHVVPEPTTIAALAGIGLLALRRRSA